MRNCLDIPKVVLPKVVPKGTRHLGLEFVNRESFWMMCITTEQ